MSNEDSLTWEQVPEEVARLVKAALDIAPAARVVGDIAGVSPGPITRSYGGPRPLAATLAGGALGAGAGYGAGWLGENLLPGTFKKNKLRRTLALLGGAVGALPGVAMGADNWTHHKDVWDTWPPEGPPGYDKPKLGSALPDAPEHPAIEKFALSPTGADFDPGIPRDGFNRVIWADPLLDRRDAAQAAGLIAAASQAAGGSAWVSPFDIARVAVGMGSGLASGFLVGKTLGALAGLSPESQNALMRAGVFAGLVKSVVPLAFGR